MIKIWTVEHKTETEHAHHVENPILCKMEAVPHQARTPYASNSQAMVHVPDVIIQPGIIWTTNSFVYQTKQTVEYIAYKVVTVQNAMMELLFIMDNVLVKLQAILVVKEEVMVEMTEEIIRLFNENFWKSNYYDFIYNLFFNFVNYF